MKKTSIDCPKEPEKSYRLFERGDPIDLVIIAPFRKIFESTRKAHDENPPYFAGEIQVDDKTDIPMKIRGRGETTKSICHFSKLKVRISDKEKKGTIFAGQRAFKIQTHCDARDKTSDFGREIAVYRDELIYQLWTLFSPIGCKTRKATITYIDSDYPNTKPFDRKDAFLIENLKDTAQRVGLKEFDYPSKKDMPRILSKFEKEFAKNLVNKCDLGKFSTAFGPNSIFPHQVIEDLAIYHAESIAFDLSEIAKDNLELAWNRLDRKHLTLTIVFNSMILNGDWNIKGIHNVRILESKDEERKIFIFPQDFDRAELVTHHFDIKDYPTGVDRIRMEIGQKKSSERPLDMLIKPTDVIQFWPIFLDNKQDIINLITNSSVDREGKSNFLGRINDFYTDMNAFVKELKSQN